MERCPTCQARLRQDPVCPRCQTDLTRLMAIESDATAWLMRSVAQLAAGDEVLALRAVEASLRLKREPLALLVHGFLLRPAPLEAEDQLGQANALIPVAGEALQAEESATEGLAQAGVIIDRVVELAKRVWRKLNLPPFDWPGKPARHDD